MKPIASNKKAFFDYQILEDWEAGVALTGAEIKAIRAKRVNISGSYIKPFTSPEGKTEMWWIGSHFNIENGDQTRSKKILLHRSEIERLVGRLSAGKFTVVPLELYLKRGLAKLKIGLASRKKKYDKREQIKKKDIERRLSEELNRRR